MARKTVMLVCAGGMSTSLLVSRMKKAAADEGFDGEIFAVSIAEAEDEIDGQTVDCILLGPQVRYMEPKYREVFESQGVAVGVIPMQDYGMMNGAGVLAFARSLMGE